MVFDRVLNRYSDLTGKYEKISIMSSDGKLTNRRFVDEDMVVVYDTRYAIKKMNI